MTSKANVLSLLILSKTNKKLNTGTIWKQKMDPIHLGKEEFDFNSGGFIQR